MDCCSAPAAQERTHQAAVVASLMLAVLRVVQQPARCRMLLVDV